MNCEKTVVMETSLIAQGALEMSRLFTVFPLGSKWSRPLYPSMDHSLDMGWLVGRLHTWAKNFF